MAAPMSRMPKRYLWIAALVAAVLAVAAVALSTFGSNDYAGVVSIEKTAEYHDPQLLARAWQLPVAALYRADFDYQHNQSFCGPTSAVDVLRSLGQHETQTSVMAGSGITTFLGFIPGGLTLDDEAALLRKKTGAPVEVERDLSLAAFRAELAHANDLSLRYVINFTRGPLFGRGHGHHSPILGYLADDDLVFIGDVNHDYQPWLVKSERLFQAMDTVDSASGRKRGLILIRVGAR